MHVFCSYDWAFPNSLAARQIVCAVRQGCVAEVITRHYCRVQVTPRQTAICLDRRWCALLHWRELRGACQRFPCCEDKTPNIAGSSPEWRMHSSMIYPCSRMHAEICTVDYK